MTWIATKKTMQAPGKESSAAQERLTNQIVAVLREVFADTLVTSLSRNVRHADGASVACVVNISWSCGERTETDATRRSPTRSIQRCKS
jgi:uncharacterized protein (UPF0147 family)